MDEWEIENGMGNLLVDGKVFDTAKSAYVGLLWAVVAACTVLEFAHQSSLQYLCCSGTQTN
jgi:hypothetical protein